MIRIDLHFKLNIALCTEAIKSKIYSYTKGII